MLETGVGPSPPGLGPMVPKSFEVISRRQDTADTWTLELQRSVGDPLAFAPGQFTMLGRRRRRGPNLDQRRSRPARTARARGARGRLATEALCAAEPGRVLGARGPFGAPWPVEQAAGADVVIAAGGIGLAPLRPAILWLLARRERYGRIVLLYGGRAPDQLLYTDELEAWAEQGLEVLVTVDSAGPEWLGHVGVVTRLVARARLADGDTFAMACGPEVMMRCTVAALRDAGVDADRVFVSMERNMQCGIGHCGHCQLGPTLVCRDGPVYRWSELEPWLAVREL
jgi:anaerobic sulfite reductase subunit B